MGSIKNLLKFMAFFVSVFTFRVERYNEQGIRDKGLGIERVGIRTREHEQVDKKWIGRDRRHKWGVSSA